MDKTGIKFTESMSRLILDGEIVGYKWYHLAGGEGSERMTIWYSENIENGQWRMAIPIIHDSFNKGIKVGDEWIFSGDELELTNDSGIKKSFMLVYSERHNSFVLDSGDLIPTHFMNSHLIENNFKKIGMIYEGDSDEH